ncbi:hypothetical protein [Sulfurimonas sp.]|uniref:hypothetical protein n=1 Tax=Sulfurimonas sp. TaxID=2022749 RepID=UPI002AB1EC79|nr:hypothetical protein [Sulfurimonas sp.]
MTTEDLEKKLNRYQTFKISLSIEELRHIAKEDNNEELLLKKLKIDTTNNYHIFSYVRNKNKEIILVGEDKVFFNFKHNPIDYIIKKFSTYNILERINKQLVHFNLYYNHNIDFFVIETKHYALKNSTEIFLLIQYNLNKSLETNVENIFTKGFFSRIFDLIYDSYAFLKNNFYKIIIFLVLYLVVYYTLVLRTMGIPLDSISEYNLLVSIKNYTTVGGTILIIPLLAILALVPLMAPKHSYKNDNTKVLKVYLSLIGYGLIFTFLSSYSLFKLNAKSIQFNDPVIIDYFQSTFYPRVVTTDKNNTVLAINESKGGYYYYYSIDNLYDKIDNTYCKEVNKEKIKLEEFMIAILKNADYTSAKNITKNRLNNHSFYNKEKSRNYFITKTREICNSTKNTKN